MTQVAKLFMNGKSQAVRLPVAYRFDTKEVFIRRGQETGDIILSRKPADWDDFLSAIQGADVPADFLSKAEREQGTQDRDPLAGCGSGLSPCAIWSRTAVRPEPKGIAPSDAQQRRRLS